MNIASSYIFSEWASVYLKVGLEPRPIMPGTKACKEPNWQKPSPELSRGTLEKWQQEKAHYGIGLRMGTPIADGTLLGALDIDHDRYVDLGAALLSNTPSGRVGKKGAVFFVRYLPFSKPPKLKYRVKGADNGDYGQVAEWLLAGTQVVIPPSIHPDTQQPYRWIGAPLYEMDFTKLPLIGG